MKLLPILSLTLASSLASNAAVLVNSSSFSYSQDFDGLGDQDATSYTFVDDSTISGWYANSEEMDTNSDEYFGSDGSENGGEVYSYGDDADRALGYLGSGGNDYTNFGVLFRNTSGATINIVSISYVGEQWRSGGDTSDNNNNFVVSHQVFAADGGSMPASTDLTGWTVTNALEFTAP